MISWADHALAAFDKRFPEPPAAVEPLDPTRRVVPIPEEMLPLPPVPEGYDRWVGRGRFPETIFEGDGRVIQFWGTSSSIWIACDTFDSNYFHIEAIKEGQP